MNKVIAEESNAYINCRKIKPWLPIDKCKIGKCLFSFVLCMLLVFLSGFSYIEFFASSRTIAILSIVCFVMCFVCFALNFNYKSAVIRFKNRVKSQKSFKNISFAIIGLLFVVSFIYNSFSSSNINGALRFALIMLSGLCIVATIPFVDFSKMFVNSLKIVFLISLPFYVFSVICPTYFATDVKLTEADTLVYYLACFSSLLRQWGWSNGGTITRFSSVFWEPSICALFANIGILLELFFVDRKSVFNIILFIVVLALTASTGGFFLFAITFALFLLTKSKGIWKNLIFAMFCLFVLLFFLFDNQIIEWLAYLLPSIFGKVNTSNSSFVTRITSIYYFFRVFVSNVQGVLVGFGPAGAFSRYNNLIASTNVDAATSTFGFLMASFGVAGLLFSLMVLFSPFLLKRFHITERIILVLLVYFLFNLENVAFVWSISFFGLYICKESIYGKEVSYSANGASSGKIVSLFFGTGENNSIIRNVNGSLFVKAAAMVVSLVAVPIYRQYFVSKELYGAWLTIISVLSWTLLFDFGLGSGMRSKLSSAIDDNNIPLQKKLISSTYVGTIVVSALFASILLILIWCLDINIIFNISVDVISSVELKLSMTILALGLCAEFIAKTIIYVLYAIRKSAIAASFGLISNLFLLLYFAIFAFFSFKGKFISASIMYAVSANIPLIAGTLFFFHGPLKKCRPNISSFNFGYCKNVMSVGIVFFVIQIGFLLITQTDSYIISFVYGPEFVTDYTYYSKIFSFFIGLLGTVVQQPLWSSIAKAKTKNDTKSIKKSIKAIFIISSILMAFSLIFGLMLQSIFNVWLGEGEEVNYQIVICFLAYCFVYLFADSLIIICNGLSIIKAQAILTSIGCIIKISLCCLVGLLAKNLIGGWRIILVIDALSYLPLCIFLPFSIKQSINKISIGGQINEKV